MEPKQKHSSLAELRKQGSEFGAGGLARIQRAGYHGGRSSTEEQCHNSVLGVPLSVWLNIDLGTCRERITRSTKT